MYTDLKRLQEFVDKMKSTSSLNEKKVIINSIKDDLFITKILHYTYNPFIKYHITSKNCKKLNHLITKSPYDTIFNLLKKLNNRTFTGHDAVSRVNGFVVDNIHYKDLIFCIIDKDLKLRASSSVINKVITGLIPTFDVALATKYEPTFCDFKNEEWLASRKLDGVRCIIRKDKDKVIAYSRKGNEFLTIQKVLDEVAMIPGNFVFDGEVCLMDKDGNEDFQAIMKQIKRKNHNIDHPKYIIFDYLTLEEFDIKESTSILSERIDGVNDLLNCASPFETLEVLMQTLVQDDDHLSQLINDADKRGFEGIMLRKNVGYEGKRSKNLLKCKKFFDEEYVVLDVDFDNHRVIREGKEVVIPMLAQVFIEHKGYRVAVGSGWSQEQRIKYQKNPEKIIGKTITVQYFEETKNQDGGISLRFPTVKHVYEKDRDV